jgi:hypothetical protein
MRINPIFRKVPAMRTSIDYPIVGFGVGCWSAVCAEDGFMSYQP